MKQQPASASDMLLQPEVIRALARLLERAHERGDAGARLDRLLALLREELDSKQDPAPSPGRAPAPAPVRRTTKFHYDEIIGDSAAMQRVYQLLDKVIGSDSTAMIMPAPRVFAAAVTHSPSGPWAKIATLSPSLSGTRSSTPKAGDMISVAKITCRSSRSLGILQRFTSAYGTRTYSAWQPWASMLKRKEPPSVVHMEPSPARQFGQEPQGVRQDVTTRSPFANPITPSPTSSTTPAISWPMITPGMGASMA